MVVSGLSPSSQVLNGRQQPLIAEINQVFDSFQSDYGAARSTYFASILNVPNPDAATTNAFTLYTRQRVSLLAQQVISTFLQTPQGTVRAKGQPTVLQQLVSRKLIESDRTGPRRLARPVAPGLDPAARHFVGHGLALFAHAG